MKKIVLALSAIVLIALLTLSVGSQTRDTAVRSRDWPLGLGPLESVPARYPRQMKSAGAAELERLAAAAGIEFAKRSGPQVPDQITDYVRAELAKTGLKIDPAPPLPDVAALRAYLLSKPAVVWDVDIARGSSAPLPNLLAMMKLGRLFTASALERARTGDAGAWDDLRAQHELTRALWRRPELISAMIALAIDRHLIAAARKMPLPAPAWFAEVRAFDHRKAMLAAMQADSWMISATMRDFHEGEDESASWVRRIVDRTIKAPYAELSRADLVSHQRDVAIAVASRQTCAFDEVDEKPSWWNRQAHVLTPNITGAWQRTFRVRAELELTEHALGLRSGSRSRCSDGQWVVTPQRIAFSKSIHSPGPSSFVIPLEVERRTAR